MQPQWDVDTENATSESQSVRGVPTLKKRHSEPELPSSKPLKKTTLRRQRPSAKVGMNPSNVMQKREMRGSRMQDMNQFEFEFDFFPETAI